MIKIFSTQHFNRDGLNRRSRLTAELKYTTRIKGIEPNQNRRTNIRGKLLTKRTNKSEHQKARKLLTCCCWHICYSYPCSCSAFSQIHMKKRAICRDTPFFPTPRLLFLLLSFPASKNLWFFI